MSRIGIFFPRAILDTVPSLVGAAELLAERGHEVDIFTYTVAGQPPAHFASEQIRVRSLGIEGLAEQTTAGLRGVVRRAEWLPRAARAPLARGYAALGAGLAHGSRLLASARTRTRGATFDFVIGVDADGLELAAAMGGGAPMAYYSLELLLLEEELTTPAERRLKESERALSQRAVFTIVQDEARARLLAEDSDLDWQRLVLVPNAPLGRARRQRACFWHERFRLAEDRRIVLHAGSLGDWTGIEDLVASVPSWPEPWLLVVHTRYDGESSPYVERLRSRASERVLFSLKPVARQDFDTLIDSADVGLAFYVPTNESAYTWRNVQTIGLSSGKLAYYLRGGLPVVVNRDASIGSSLEDTGCGLAVEDAHQVGKALECIGERYEQFSRAALQFFDEQLDFRRAFAGAIERIESVLVRA
jgi:hypothetical protein